MCYEAQGKPNRLDFHRFFTLFHFLLLFTFFLCVCVRLESRKHLAVFIQPQQAQE